MFLGKNNWHKTVLVKLKLCLFRDGQNEMLSYWVDISVGYWSILFTLREEIIEILHKIMDPYNVICDHIFYRADTLIM